MSSIITIIVPVYNSSNYINRFVSSIKHQTLQNFNVIFINDASTDDTIFSLKKETSNDKRFIIINLNKNYGPGFARNCGIRETKTPLVCFADVDDILPSNSLELRYKAYIKYNAIIRGSYEVFLPGCILGGYQKCNDNVPEVFTPKQSSNLVNPYTLISAHWCWLFPTKFLLENNIFYNETIKQAEDLFMLGKAFWNIERCVWIQDIVYYYFRNGNSITAKFYNILNMIEFDKQFYEYAENNKCIDIGDNYFFQHCLFALKNILQHCIKNEISNTYVEKIISNYKIIFEKYEIYNRYYNKANKNDIILCILSFFKKCFSDLNIESNNINNDIINIANNIGIIKL